METNLRIIKSIKVLNDNLKDLQKEVSKDQKEIDRNKINTEKAIKDIKDIQIEIITDANNLERELKQRINTIELTPGPKGDKGDVGPKGDRGLPGKDGIDGRPGPKGDIGLTGPSGRDGKDGKDGRDGKDGIGIPGKNGQDGVGVLDVRIDKKGDLITTLTDGRTINAGNVKGQYTVGLSGKNGKDGVSVVKAEIIDHYLYITLSNGEIINAGYIGGSGPGEEVDPIFTQSPAYNITDTDITNWNNKSDFSGDYNDLTNKPELFSGSYNDLTDKPDLFSGDYNDLTNKPTIPVVPTNVSAFTNDAGYLTQHQDISGKYDKTGGEISGNVKIDGTLTLDIDDPDYDSGITFNKALDTNLGTVLTLNGYAGSTNYKPIIRNIGTPNSNYDVANKKYVDDNVVVPTYHLVFLNPDGTVDTYASTINYNTIKNNLTDPKEKDYLDVVWNTTRFYAEVVEVTDVNTGDIKFITDIEYAGIPRRMVFTLNPQSILTTTSITTSEIISNKSQSVLTDTGSIDKYPSIKAIEDFVKPVVIWESNTPADYLKAVQANLSASPTWQLTNLDMTPFKRIKIYSCAGQKSGTTASASTTPAIVLEMSLDSRNAISAYGGNYVGSIVVQKPNDNNRLATLTCAVSADKTSFVVLRQTSLYGTAATGNDDVNANVFLIEGYYY